MRMLRLREDTQAGRREVLEPRFTRLQGLSTPLFLQGEQYRRGGSSPEVQVSCWKCCRSHAARGGQVVLNLGCTLTSPGEL